jgi:ABC-type glycerol-3-phosphate transport system substrate-binding protein
MSVVLFTSAWAYLQRPLRDPYLDCGFTPPAPTHHTGPTAITLTVWAIGPGESCARPFAPALAAPFVADERINVVTTPFLLNANAYYSALHQQRMQSSLPDLFQARASELHNGLPESGYIEPLDDCIRAHPEFQTIHPDLWRFVTHNGRVWGIPIGVGFFALHYSKTNLRKLGWSEPRIQALPDEIRNGQITLFDLADYAHQAVDQGIVSPGFGLWFAERDYPGDRLNIMSRAFNAIYGNPIAKQMHINQAQLVNTLRFIQHSTQNQLRQARFDANNTADSWNRSMTMRDAYLQNRVLFWIDYASEWGNLAYDKAIAQGGVEYVNEHIGLALIPSAQRGQPGYVTGLDPAFFVISSVVGSQRHHQQTACKLLAHMLRPQVLAPVLIREFASPLKSSVLFGTPVLDDMSRLKDYADPPDFLPTHNWDDYREGLDRVLSQSKARNETPEQQAAAVVMYIRAQFGTAVVIE